MKNVLIHRLTHLRLTVESEARTNIIDVQTNFALALSDVCQELKLDEAEERRVLGDEAYSYVHTLPIFAYENDRDDERDAAMAQELLGHLSELSSVRAGHIVLRS